MRALVMAPKAALEAFTDKVGLKTTALAVAVMTLPGVAHAEGTPIAAGAPADVGFDPTTKLLLVVGGVIALIGVVAAASITIEALWKGHQKAKQTVKKL